jgi:hypothetical protein
MNVLVKVAVAAAAAAVSGLAAAGCAAHVAAAPRGSVQACTAFGVRAIQEHRTVTQVPAACRGLSRAEVNFALGRSIYLVAGSGHHKVKPPRSDDFSREMYAFLPGLSGSAVPNA